MEQKIEVMAIGSFDGNNIKKNKSIDLKFKFGIDQRSEVIKAVMLVGQDVSVFTKQGKEKAKFIGVFRFNGMNIDRDGETKITFNSLLEEVRVDAMNEMIENGEYMKIKMVADVELEDETEDDE